MKNPGLAGRKPGLMPLLIQTSGVEEAGSAKSTTTDSSWRGQELLQTKKGHHITVRPLPSGGQGRD